MALPLIEDGSGGQQRSLRTLDSILTSSAITEILKQVVREKRPDGSGHSSFPSGHATAAAAAAVMQSEYHPIQTPVWAAGAALISISRAKLHRHYTHDVLAGAAIGAATYELELYAKRGLLFSGDHASGTAYSPPGGFQLLAPHNPQVGQACCSKHRFRAAENKQEAIEG